MEKEEDGRLIKKTKRISKEEVEGEIKYEVELE